MVNKKCQYFYLAPTNLVPKTFTADFWKSVKSAWKSVCCQVGHYAVVQYLKKRRQRWHFTWVKYHWSPSSSAKNACHIPHMPFMPYGIYLICHVSYMSSIEHAIYGIVNFSLGFDVLLDIWAFQKKTLLLSFEKGAPWKQVSSFLWQCFNALNSRADVERKECNNILAKLLQILLTFRDVGRWNQTVRGTILSKGHLKDSILEYKWIYSSQLWIT